jgi:hypothetical protein
VHDWAGFGAWEERREELVREAERRRLVRELREEREARYRRRNLREWRLDAANSLEVREELPARGWRRIFTLLGIITVPFIGAFSARKEHK